MKEAAVVHLTLASSLRAATCPFNIFLCNGNCSSTIIRLHSLILCWLHACAPHWLLCAGWRKLDARSPHSRRETASKAVAMGRTRKNHFGILTFSLLVTFVWSQRYLSDFACLSLPFSCPCMSCRPSKSLLACDINQPLCITPPFLLPLLPPQRQGYERPEQYAPRERNRGQADEGLRHSVEARFRR